MVNLHIETHFHAANPSAAFVINRYGVTGTLRRGVRNVFQYGVYIVTGQGYFLDFTRFLHDIDSD
jgi:hypothetical protein